MNKYNDALIPIIDFGIFEEDRGCLLLLQCTILDIN